MTRAFPLGRSVGITRAVLAVCVLSLGGALVSPALADREDRLEDRKARLGADIRGAERALDASSSQLMRASNALAASRARLSDARGLLADLRGQLAAARALDAQMQERLVAAEARLVEAEQQLDESEADLVAQEAEVERLVVEAYTSGDPRLVTMGLVMEGASPTELTERVAATESVVEAQTADLDSLDAARVMLTLREQRVEELRDEVAVQRAEAAANLERQQDLTAQARDQRNQVAELVSERSVARERAERAKAQDAQVLARMEANRAQVEDRLARLAARQAREARQARREQRESSVPTTSTSSGPSDGGGFLSYPVDSYITSPYGMRLHPILRYYKLHDGTDFGAGCGTPIRAAAAGTVVSRYYNAGYGNRVIMNHGLVNGVSLSTSYNHLSGFAVGPGQYVQRGQVVGYVGTTGYSTGCHLHFMVYEAGGTVDPMGWL